MPRRRPENIAQARELGLADEILSRGDDKEFTKADDPEGRKDFFWSVLTIRG